MNSASNIDLFETDSSSLSTATVFLGDNFAKPSKNSFSLSRIAAATGLAVFLSFAPSTAVIDPWLMERRLRESAVTMSIYKEVIGRLVTRSEALRIANQILHRAEQERLAIAEHEAARGIQWG